MMSTIILHPVTPSNQSKLQLVHPKIIDWNQYGPPILEIYADDNALLALLTM